MNIWAVGRNYANHAKELGNDIPKTPLIFLKAGSTLSTSQKILLPSWSKDVHHEIELILQIGANSKITQVGLALDLTERAAQAEAKKMGLPWTMAKSFKNSTPISAMVDFESNETNLNTLQNLELKLWVNDQLRQSGHTSQMIFKIPELIQYVQNIFPVEAGDLLLTGTPEGVGPLQHGDHVRAEIRGLSSGVISMDWDVEKT